MLKKKPCSSKQHKCCPELQCSTVNFFYVFIYLFSLNGVVRQDHILLVTFLSSVEICTVPGFMRLFKCLSVCLFPRYAHDDVLILCVSYFYFFLMI